MLVRMKYDAADGGGLAVCLCASGWYQHGVAHQGGGQHRRDGRPVLHGGAVRREGRQNGDRSRRADQVPANGSRRQQDERVRLQGPFSVVIVTDC